MNTDNKINKGILETVNGMFGEMINKANCGKHLKRNFEI